MTVVVRPADGGIAYVGRRLAQHLDQEAGTVRDLALSDEGNPARNAWRAWRARAGDVASHEVVHLELGRTTLAVFWFGILAMLTRRPVVAVLHDFPVVVNRPGVGMIRTSPGWRDRIAHRLLSPLLDDLLLRWFRTHVRATGVLSHDLIESAHTAGWRAPGSALHGADPPRALTPPSAGTYALLAGFLAPGKGVEFALDSWPTEDGSMALKVVGTVSRQHEGWLRAVREERPRCANGSIEWVGFVDDDEFADLMAGAAIVIVPYERSNPVSGIVVRALVDGRAMVCTRVSATTEIRDGDSGIVVDFGDVAAMSDAIRRLIADPALRDELGAGAARTGAGHTWRRHAADIESLHRIAAMATQ